ncbi:tyrosine-type recombinase/integrase [Magnetovibrio blakemorei]|uniref:Tyr recombinase domain-containing protein n=1 Tax=Magnetovibrio blakemorei TaxID=28181 RepID=A0A1E5Q8L5_9PROT|nr:tyrosine-type recombinase/integrase [Magnetovibrio blakemorei]OEJ67737.1 hypothetical protein BEN30_08370 [Magnetovibrio blakemorei]
MGSEAVHFVNGKPVAVVYDMAHTKALYIRVKNSGQKGWKSKAAGTSNHDEAKNRAIAWYFEREGDLKAGFQLKSKQFKDVAEAFLDNYKSNMDAGLPKHSATAYAEKKALIHRYFLPFFGDMGIDRVGKAGIEDYIKFRMTFWEKRIGAGDDFIEYERGGRTIKRRVKEGKPSAATIKRENATLKQIFDYAQDQGWLTLAHKPKVMDIGGRSEKRPAFTRKQMQLILGKSWQRKSDKKLARTVVHYRDQLALYIAFLYYTGIRPGEEANAIKWKHLQTDLDEANNEVRMIVVNAERAGKTKGSARKVIPKGGLWTVLDYYRAKQALFCMDDDYIFCTYEGDKIHSMKKAFSRYMDELGVTHDAYGKPYSLYSLRHSYATHNIKELGAWIIAKNMGHSDVKMLEKHYAHDTPVDHHDKLS